MFANMLARLTGFGALTLALTGPTLAQSAPAPDTVFDRTYELGWLHAVAAMPDGGMVVVGRRFVLAGTGGSIEEHFPVAIRLGPDGHVRWRKEFSNRKSGEAQALQLLPGGGMRITGSAGPDFSQARTIRHPQWIAELDAEGQVTRDQAVDLGQGRDAGKLVPIAAAGFAFHGSDMINTGVPGMDFVMTDAWGSKLWQAKMDDVGDCQGAATADPEGRLVAAVGATTTIPNTTSARFRRFDKQGRVIHDQPFSAFDDACPGTIRAVPGGGFIVAGSRTNVVDAPSGWVARLDSDGSPLWERQFGPGKGFTVGYDAAPAPDGSFVVAACTDGDPMEGRAIRFGPAGEPGGERRFVSESGLMPGAVDVADDGTVLLAGVRGALCGVISGKIFGGEAWATALAPDVLAPGSRFGAAGAGQRGQPALGPASPPARGPFLKQ